MSKNLSLIQAITLSSNASVVSFTNIPQNFTHLIIKGSARTVRTGESSDYLMVTVNTGVPGSGSGYGYVTLQGAGTGSPTSNSGGSGSTGAGSAIGFDRFPSSTTTTGIFGSFELNIPNYTSNATKLMSSEAINEDTVVGTNIVAQSSIWTGTTAITAVNFYFGGGTAILANSSFYLYGIGGRQATGGTISDDGVYTYHTFTSSGVFAAFDRITNAEALIIAGGGGGGARGGGGGAGGVIYAFNQVFNSGTQNSILIGAGGSAGANTTSNANNGSNSYFLNFTAIGGGRGGSANATRQANSGGSGGGNSSGSDPSGGSGLQTSGSNYIGYGNAGGIGASAGQDSGGGGGGAGAVGEAGTTTYAGRGGDGTNLFWKWAEVTSTGSGGYYAAGGGAGANSERAQGGVGGGGNGGTGADNATAGTSNTGSGGGAGGNTYVGRAGGSGIVIIRYPNK